MAVEVLVTGGDTDLGRVVAEGFRDDGHKVTLVGARRGDLEVAAKELDVDAIVCDTTDPAGLSEVRGLFPHHLDTIVNVPAPSFDAGDPRTYSLSDTANAWRNTLDATVLSAVLTVQALGDYLRSGGSIISVMAGKPARGQCRRRHQGRPVELGRRASEHLRDSWHHGQRRRLRAQRPAGLRRPVPHAAVGRGRNRPTGTVFDHDRGPPHHRPDAARQPRRADPVRLSLFRFRSRKLRWKP